MQYTSLGKTGLRASVAGLGCGGYSQLGLSVGKSEDDAVALVRSAIDLGVNFFDASEAYSTEHILGRAMAGVPRDRIVVCTKSRYRNLRTGELHAVKTVLANLEESLRRLAVDQVDLYMVHGVLPVHYEHVLHEIAPALIREKEKGKIAHLGLSEFPARDPDHLMLPRALNDPLWEVIMFSLHMMHQGARRTVLPRALEQGVGTVLMYAVRNIFSRPGVLQETMKQLAEKGVVPSSLANDDPLGFLIHEGGATSLTDAAYRFARHEPGADVVLFGTSDVNHLRANVESLLRPPLPPADVEKLYALFGHLSGVGLDIPDIEGKSASPRPG
jgi:aryl-alcohol dehydrogenase-like predicted oxidoreductase